MTVGEDSTKRRHFGLRENFRKSSSDEREGCLESIYRGPKRGENLGNKKEKEENLFIFYFLLILFK